VPAELPPYTLLTNSGSNSYDLDKEDLRIVMLALAGFDLTREERVHIRGFYFHIFNELSPGTLRPGALEEACRAR
jgi:hypothetical protein